MPDVLKSITAVSGELCVVTVLTTGTRESPALCSVLGEHFFLRIEQYSIAFDLRYFYLIAADILLLLRRIAVATRILRTTYFSYMAFCRRFFCRWKNAILRHIIVIVTHILYMQEIRSVHIPALRQRHRTDLAGLRVLYWRWDVFSWMLASQSSLLPLSSGCFNHLCQWLVQTATITIFSWHKKVIYLNNGKNQTISIAYPF